jgi:hypothetical protein
VKLGLVETGIVVEQGKKIDSENAWSWEVAYKEWAIIDETPIGAPDLTFLLVEYVLPDCRRSRTALLAGAWRRECNSGRSSNFWWQSAMRKLHVAALRVTL